MDCRIEVDFDSCTPELRLPLDLSTRDCTPELVLPPVLQKKRPGDGRIVHDISLRLSTTNESISLELDVDGAFNDDGTEQDSAELLKVALEPRWGD